MVVKYEKLNELIPDILRFLDVFTQKRVQEFKKSWRPRNANWASYPQVKRTGIERIYGEYRDWWLNLDDKMLFSRSG